MKPSFRLTFQDASVAIDRAFEEASARGWSISAAVVDQGGHLIAFGRQDGAAPLTAMIAFGKARAAALSRRASATLEQAISAGRAALLTAADDHIVMMEGGEPVVSAGDEVVGAVGVSGRAPEEDSLVAKHAVAVLKQ